MGQLPSSRAATRAWQVPCRAAAQARRRSTFAQHTHPGAGVQAGGAGQIGGVHPETRAPGRRPHERWRMRAAAAPDPARACATAGGPPGCRPTPCRDLRRSAVDKAPRRRSRPRRRPRARGSGSSGRSSTDAWVNWRRPSSNGASTNPQWSWKEFDDGGVDRSQVLWVPEWTERDPRARRESAAGRPDRWSSSSCGGSARSRSRERAQRLVHGSKDRPPPGGNARIGRGTIDDAQRSGERPGQQGCADASPAPVRVHPRPHPRMNRRVKQSPDLGTPDRRPIGGEPGGCPRPDRSPGTATPACSARR